MTESNGKYDEDDILTYEEEQKINKLRGAASQEPEPSMSFNGIMSALGKLNIGAMAAVSNPLAEFKFGRRIGLNPIVKVNNISGKKAWIVLTPAPIMGISSLGVDNFGQIAFSSTGDYKCQQSSISNNNIRDFELDNSQIYYTVFFDCDGKWKTPFKDRKINTRKYDINLLERHVEDAIEVELLPIN